MNKVTRIKNCNYTTISNVFLRDKNLSLKAKGLLAVILSLPETWDFSIKGICKTLKEGTTAIYSAIDELKEYGYCKVTTNRNEKGMIVGNDYAFYEDPNVENLNVDNQAQRSINISLPNTKEPNNKEITKEEKEIKLKKKQNNVLFERLWVMYRRHGSKAKAMEYFNKLSQDEKDMLEAHIKAYVASTSDVHYQKHFERYLRDKTFLTVVYGKGNNVVYDPERGKTNVYQPSGNFSISYDEQRKIYWYIGYYYDGMVIGDGYTDDNRPDNATLVLNNGRGTIVWSSMMKVWVRQ